MKKQGFYYRSTQNAHCAFYPKRFTQNPQDRASRAQPKRPANAGASARRTPAGIASPPAGPAAARGSPAARSLARQVAYPGPPRLRQRGRWQARRAAGGSTATFISAGAARTRRSRAGARGAPPGTAARAVAAALALAFLLSLAGRAGRGAPPVASTCPRGGGGAAAGEPEGQS